MIVRNEGHQLADCLAPVAELFDEIVVVDTGSHDDTKEVARRFTPCVFDFPWCDDFAAARNECLRQSTGEWIFWLDADDRLAPANVARLKKLLDGLSDEPRAYLIDTNCIPVAACEGARMVTHPRLFRRHPDLRWQGRVHEQLRPAPAVLGYECVACDVQIDHVGYSDGALRQRKLQRDLRLLGMDYAVNPGDVSTLLHLGTTHAQLGHNDKARTFLQQLASAGLGNADHMRQVYGLLAELAFREGRYSDVIGHIARGLELFPDDEHLLYVLAEAYFEIDNYEAAKLTIARLLASPALPQYRGGGLADIRSKLAVRVLGNVLRMQGDYAAAEATLVTILRNFPHDTYTWYMLGLIYLDTNRRPPLDSVVHSLAACPQGRTFAGLLDATWRLRHSELNAAGVLIDQLVAEAPQMPLPRVLRIEWLRRTGASREAQIQACRDLLRVDPGDVGVTQELQRLQSAQRATTLAPSDWCSSVVLGAGLPEVAV